VNPKYRLAFIIVAAVVLLDQATKFWVHKSMALYQSIEVIPHFANLTYIRNPGAAFSFLAESRPSLRMTFLVVVAIAAIACIVFLLKITRSDRRSFTVGLSLILGGAVGNLIDRLRLGEVADFIDLYWNRFHWPAFNLADSAITIGVILLLIRMLRQRSWNT
jgi:signal peptidase II